MSYLFEYIKKEKITKGASLLLAFCVLAYILQVRINCKWIVAMSTPL